MCRSLLLSTESYPRYQPLGPWEWWLFLVTGDYFSVTTNIRLRCNSKSVYVCVTGSCGKQCASEDVHLLSLPISDHWPGPNCCYLRGDYFCYVVTAVIVTVGLINSKVTVTIFQDIICGSWLVVYVSRIYNVLIWCLAMFSCRSSSVT